MTKDQKERTNAMEWWNSLPDYGVPANNGKHGICVHYYPYRMWQSLTGREIEKIWNYEKRPEMGKVNEFTQQVEGMLFNIYDSIGIDKPENHEQILIFVADDVLETADPLEWHSGDVAIAFRRWVEAQVKPDMDVIDELKSGFDAIYSTPIDEIIRLGNLSPLELQRELQNNDSKYHTDGNVQPKPVKLITPLYGSSAPDTRNKQPIINALIVQIIDDGNNGDSTVLDELLKNIPFEILLHSLPEEDWDKYREPDKTIIGFGDKLYDETLTPIIWCDIRSDFEDEKFIYIDAYDTPMSGQVIAKVRISDNHVIYLDERARTDKYAQEVIQKCFNRL